MKQKTAVEWLIGRFHYEGFIGFFCSEELIKSKREIMIEIIDQAKAMEKNQNKFFFECGRNFQLKGEETFEQCYNETFKSE